MNSKQFSINRIDQSIADNLNAIQTSFGEDAGIVKDFIVFINKRIKEDPFGYTRFTLNEFCKETGRNKQDLCLVHPTFRVNSKNKPPEYWGHKFETVFDYVLFSMMQKNIIFSRSYSYNEGDTVIHLKHFPILKDIKIYTNSKENGTKIHEVRISDEWMNGFMKRYYTIETNGYRSVGKGRGGDGRKNLFIFLYKIRHILLSQKAPCTQFTVDQIADIANLNVLKNKNRKTSIKRTLDIIKRHGQLPFTYRFVQGDFAKRKHREYWVSLDFSEGECENALQERFGDTIYFNTLIPSLIRIFNERYPARSTEKEKDLFQCWLTNEDIDINEKITAIQKAWLTAYKQQLTCQQAYHIMIYGSNHLQN